MKVKFYLESPKGTKRNKEGKAETAIFARISYNGNQLKYYTPESIIPIHWSKENHRAKEYKKYPEFPEFNERLDNIERTIKNTIRKYANDNENEYPSTIVLKDLLDSIYSKKKKHERQTFMKFFADFIERSRNGTRLIIKGTRKGKPITSGTVKTYETTKECLEKYQQKRSRRIDFENLDMRFYHDFVSYCTKELNLKPNYIGKHVKTIKTVVKDAKENFRIQTNPEIENSAFMTISEEVDNIYLSEEELSQLYSIDFSSNKKLERVRDLFIIGCHTGLRFSDLKTLQPEQINNGMITLTQVKTTTPIAIPVHDTVKEIMARYEGKLPKALPNQKMNEALKEMGEYSDLLKHDHIFKETKGGITKTLTMPKYKLICTHSARRSFCTNEFIAGTPTLILMSISGHKTEKAFMRYIKIAKPDMALMLSEIWHERRKKAEQKIEANDNTKAA